MKLSDIALRLLDILTPPRATERIVRALTLHELQVLTLRGHKSGSLPYHDPRVTALVWELKYYAHARAAALAGTVLAEILIGIASEEIGKPLLIPIPMHRIRRHARGHNQTEVLCEATVSHVQSFFEYAPRALVRIHATPPQQKLHKYERGRNLYGSMEVIHTSSVRGRICVVVDDVSTTGATFTEARRALEKAGAQKVICVALAYS